MNPWSIPPILFNVSMALAISGWLALVFFPSKRWANFWYAGLLVPLTLSILYVYLLVAFWFMPPQGSFTKFLSLDGVQRMFANQGLLLVAFLDILSMDLVCGAWMTRKAAQVRIPYVYLLPCLVATFLQAGIGFALFALVVSLGSRWGAIADFESVPSTDSAQVEAVVGRSSELHQQVVP